MRVEELTSFSDVQSLLPEWECLYDRCPDATPFHSADWLLGWWRHFGFGSLWVLALRDGSDLLGLAPLFIHDYNPNGRGAIRQLSPVGIGITDYTDFLMEPRHAADVSETVLRHLARRLALWNAADLPGLRENCEVLKASAPPNLAVQKTLDQPCPLLPLPRSWKKFQASLSSNRRHAYQSAQKKVERLGPISFETARPRSWGELFEALVRLNHACRSARNLERALGDSKVQQFHREVGEAFLRRGWLHTTAMRIGSRIVAILHGFVSGSRAYYYQSGFDPRLTKMSLGTLIQAHAIEWCIEHGLLEIDFLRGSEPYKYWWGARNRQSYRLLLEH